MFDVHATLTGPDDAILLVRVPRLLTHESAEPLRDAVVQGLPKRDGAGVLLDMADVELISSIGVAALLQVFEHCRDQAAVVIIAGLPARQRDFLRMLKIDAKFRFAPTIEDAITELTA